LKNPKANKLITAVLTFAILIFGIGSYLFWNNHSANAQLKKELLESGIKTKAYILSMSKKDKRKLSYTDFKWQFMSNYLVEYWYDHTGTEASTNISLKDYFNGGPKKDDTGKGLGKIEIQNSVSKSMYKNLESKESFQVIYLKDKPKSVKILNAVGEVEIPPLNMFAYLCIFLTLSSVFMLWYYMKTGTTF